MRLHKRTSMLVPLLLLFALILMEGCAGTRPSPRYSRDRHRTGPDGRERDRETAGETTTKPPSDSNDALDRMVELWYGTPYLWGGETLHQGVDCSGYVQSVINAVYGVQLPRTSRQQFQVGSPVTRDQLQRGDLVFFNTNGRGVSHVGIYLGDGFFTHASTTRGVTIDPLFGDRLGDQYVGARRVRGKRR